MAHALPLLMIAFVVWLERRGRPRPWWAVTVPAALAAALPLGRLFREPSLVGNGWGLLPFERAGLTAARILVPLGAVAAVACFLWAPRLALVGVAAFLAASTAIVYSTIRDQSRATLARSGVSDRRWLDRAADGPVTYLNTTAFEQETREGRWLDEWLPVWGTEFWNRRFDGVLTLAGALEPAPFFQRHGDSTGAPAASAAVAPGWCSSTRVSCPSAGSSPRAAGSASTARRRRSGSRALSRVCTPTGRPPGSQPSRAGPGAAPSRSRPTRPARLVAGAFEPLPGGGGRIARPALSRTLRGSTTFRAPRAPFRVEVTRRPARASRSGSTGREPLAGRPARRRGGARRVGPVLRRRHAEPAPVDRRLRGRRGGGGRGGHVRPPVAAPGAGPPRRRPRRVLRRPRRLAGSLDRLVGRSPIAPGTTSTAGSSTSRSSRWGCSSPRSCRGRRGRRQRLRGAARARDRVRAARERHPLALSGLRTRRAAADAGRLLERARAARRLRLALGLWRAAQRRIDGTLLVFGSDGDDPPRVLARRRRRSASLVAGWLVPRPQAARVAHRDRARRGRRESPWPPSRSRCPGSRTTCSRIGPRLRRPVCSWLAVVVAGVFVAARGRRLACGLAPAARRRATIVPRGADRRRLSWLGIAGVALHGSGATTSNAAGEHCVQSPESLCLRELRCPARLVARGVGVLRGRAARRHRRGLVRALAPASPRALHAAGHRAAQPRAAGARRDRDRRLPALRRHRRLRRSRDPSQAARR